VQPPTHVPDRTASPVIHRFAAFLFFVVVATAVFATTGSGPARADVVGTGYGEADLVDLQWATDHLDYDTPAELQKVGVGVVDFILQISGRTDHECDLGLDVQLDPYRPHRFATTWTGTDLAVLDRVADHYCVSREQAQSFGATILAFFAGLDAGRNGTTAERLSLADVMLPVGTNSPEMVGNGDRKVLLDEPPPVDHRVVAYSHTGAGSFRVVAHDLAGEEVEVVVERSGTVSGRALVDDPGSMAALEVVADGEWTLSFEAVSTRPEVDGITLGSGDEVLLIPAHIRGTTLRYRHVGSGMIVVRTRGFDGGAATEVASADSDMVSRLRIPLGARIIEVEGAGEWGLVDGDILPPGHPTGIAVEAGDGAVDVSWSAPVSGGSPITRFRVDLREVPGGDGEGSWTTVEVNGSVRGTTIEGLRNGVAHQFRVQAVNEVGSGLWSGVTTAAPMAAVKVVEADGLVATAGDRLVQLAWNGTDGAASYSLVYYDETRVLSGTAVIRGGMARRWPMPLPPSLLALRSVHRRPSVRLPSIVGGEKVAAGDRTHVVALLSSGQPDAFQAQYCGGTLIAPHWVLTAAHCVADKAVDEIEVVAGATNLEAVTTADRIGVVALHIHEAYDADRILHDIGLIELAGAADGTPIPWQEDGDLPLAGTAVEVAGWGAVSADSELYESDLKASVGRVLGGPGADYCGSWRGFRSGDELCIGGPAGVGACGGDSGGPVTAELGMLRVVGVTSYGLSGACNDPTYPNVASRVSGHSAWIEARVGDPWQTVENLVDPNYTVDGLVNGRTYTFHVTPVDAMGRSLAPMQVTVSPAGPPAAPTGLQGRGGDGIAVLTWEAAFTGSDDPVVDHVVEYSADGVAWTTVDDGTTTGTSLTVSGLANESTLEFRVMAVNGRGAGPASVPVTVVVGQPDAPTGLVAVTGDGMVRLTWSAPADDGGSPILDYVLERRVDDGWVLVDDGLSIDTVAVVSGLMNGAREDFRVAAVTAVGPGPTGEVVTSVPGRPDPVADLDAAVGDGEVTLSWTATDHDGGSPVLDHWIEYSFDDGSSWRPVGGVIGTATEATVHGLQNGTAYRFRVAVVTAIGTSRTRSVGATPATVPGRATGLMVVGGESTLVFSWQRPSDGGSPFTRVKVDLAQAGSDGWQTFEAGAATTTARIGGLEPGQEYLVRVIYENALGAGDPSEVLRVLVR